MPNENPLHRKLSATLIFISRQIFWFGVAGFVLGEIITFVPGGEQEWFTIAAILVAFGFLVPKRLYRIAALIFLVLSILAAIEGHKQGIKYRQFLETKRHSQAR